MGILITLIIGLFGATAVGIYQHWLKKTEHDPTNVDETSSPLFLDKVSKIMP